MTQAYFEGFKKVAEAHGIDPELLKQAAWWNPATWQKGLRQASKLKNLKFMSPSRLRGTAGSYIAGFKKQTPGTYRVIEKGDTLNPKEVWWKTDWRSKLLGERFGVQPDNVPGNATAVLKQNADLPGKLSADDTAALWDFAEKGTTGNGNLLSQLIRREVLGPQSKLVGGANPKASFFQNLLGRLQETGKISK